MSSLTRRPNGHRWLQFLAKPANSAKSKRFTMRLGPIDVLSANLFKRNLDDLIDFRRHCLEPGPVLLLWVEQLNDRYYTTLASAGLVASRVRSKLADLLELHRKRMIANNARPQSMVILSQVYANLLTYFTTERDIRLIDRDDADKFKLWLDTSAHVKGCGLSPATVSRRVRHVKEIFNVACEPEVNWLRSNPFSHIKKGSEVNTERDAYIGVDDFQKLLGVVECDHFRLLLVLCRYGGLRCPSEIRPLKWQDFDFTEKSVSVKSVKTNRHPGRERRMIPMFPAIEAQAELAKGQGDKSSDPAFPMFQNSGVVIRNRLERACRHAGLIMWPKPFVNFRASCETDLFHAGFPVDQVTNWLGHSAETALNHYNRASLRESTVKAASCDKTASLFLGNQSEAVAEAIIGGQ